MGCRSVGKGARFPRGDQRSIDSICRSVGFDWVGRRPIVFAGETLTTNHWQIESGANAAR
jgi:hypothetical protein